MYSLVSAGVGDSDGYGVVFAFGEPSAVHVERYCRGFAVEFEKGEFSVDFSAIGGYAAKVVGDAEFQCASVPLLRCDGSDYRCNSVGGDHECAEGIG